MADQKRIWRLGIDVGGTNTDAVVIDGDLKLVAATKSPTTEDVMSGIVAAMHEVITQIGADAARNIGFAMLGTTHCTNAIVERKRLNKVAALRVGDPALVADLEPALVDAAYAEITRIIEDAVDAMKTSAGDVTVILVGGGSILAPDRLEGSDNVLRPENFGVANAVGSAIAQVSGQIAKVFSLTETPRDQALAESKQRACDEAIEAGADPSTVEVVDVEDIPMAYLGDALCIRVKAVGDLML